MKAQGATEYLVILGAILFVALMASVVLFWPVGSTSDVKQSQSDIKYKIRAMEHPELTQGLVAYYKFDEGMGGAISNAVGNVNNGVMTNGTWVDGKSGKAAQFANTGYVTFSSAQLSNLSKFTTTYWYNATSFAADAGVGQTIQTIYIDGSNSYRLGMGGTGALAVISRYSGTSNIVTTTSLVLTPLNSWKFIAISFDNSTIKVYVDGAEVATAAGALSVPVGNYIGAFSPSAGKVAGSIQDVRIYNRVLSPEEIALLYYHIGYP
ncbi:Concanavalin A-like lectin/glucanases superfamily protein [Candidatus Anstonella stagnisolia]|nr:Concanavalin A-like lectin/glucanases superfamily protein [Candidatus Anstonella stagnisolia]